MYAPLPIVDGGCAAAKTIALLIIVLIMGSFIIKEMDLALNGGIALLLNHSFKRVSSLNHDRQ
jgi:hypothetical protein